MAKKNEATAIDTTDELFETEEKPMSEEDRKQLDDELASVDDQIIAIKGERSKVLAKYRVSLRKLEDRQKVLLDQRRDEIVEVRFPVIEEHDDETMMVHVVRKDNAMKIGSRAMTEPEKEAARKRRQKTIPGVVDDDYVPPATDPGTPKAKRSKKGSKK